MAKIQDNNASNQKLRLLDMQRQEDQGENIPYALIDIITRLIYEDP